MSILDDLYSKHGQSPWLDNLRRSWLQDGEIQRRIDEGVRGLTSNPSIFQKAITSDTTYDEQFFDLVAAGTDIEDAYWALVTQDISDALALLDPVYTSAGGKDGFVSVEVSPALAHDTFATIEAAKGLAKSLPQPNLLIKIPATLEGLPAITATIAAGSCVNVTLIFGLERYEAVIEAYLQGLEQREGDLSTLHSVASFFVSRVDTKVDAFLEDIGTAEALALRGSAAVAQARQAFVIASQKFSGARWDSLHARGANAQRPLWASTSTKNPAYPDTLYVDSLIGPNTVNTIPDATLDAFIDHGVLADTIETGKPAEVLKQLAAAGIDMQQVADELEKEGVASFLAAHEDLLDSLREKAAR
ncbi:MAG: transaldolase [Acidimicrobiales bacterium]